MNQKEEPKITQKLAKDKRVQMFLNSVMITLSNIAVFGLGGWFLDKKFETDHTFLIIGLVVSFPITQFILYKRAQDILKKK